MWELLTFENGSSSSAWPTPTAKGNHNRAGLSERSGDGLSTAVDAGPLNPAWVESLMGFPTGWTDLDPEALGRLRAERRNARGKRPVPNEAS